MTHTDDRELAIDEVAAAMRSIRLDDLDHAADLIAGAGRVAVYGAGREGVALRGLTMRLFHAGIDASMVGDMTCPAVGKGDLFVVSCGPGHLSTVAALAGRARDAGAGVLYFTAEPALPPVELATDVVVIDAQTMARDQGSTSVLPMGSSYEVALFMLADLVTNRVRLRRRESPAEMRSRHTNLE